MEGERTLVLTAVLDVLPLALGAAFNPVGITVLLLLLGRPDALRAGGAWTGGFVIGLAAAVAVAHLFALRHFARRIDDPRIDVAKVDIAVGALMVAWAIWTIWRGRRPSNHGPLAKMLAVVPRLRGWQLVLLSAGLTIASMKNIALAGAAGARLGADRPGASAVVVALLLFLLVAALPMLVPLLIAARGGQTGSPRLDALNGWVVAHLSQLSGVSILVLGAAMLRSGLHRL
jgi:hypothetical protein